MQWNSVSLDRTSHFLSRKIVIFAHLEQHLNAMLGSSFIANFMLTEIGPRGVITCSRGSPEVSTGSYPFKVWEKGENNTFPIPQISRFFLRMRETSEGTSSYMVRFVLRHFAADERFARNEPSPEIPLTLPFPGIFGGFSARYSYTNHSQDHGQVAGVSVCVRVCGWVLCMLCAVLCFFCSEIWGKWINMDNKTGSNHGRKVVRKMQKNTGNSGKNIKPRTPFLARFGHPRTEKRSENGHNSIDQRTKTRIIVSVVRTFFILWWTYFRMFRQLNITIFNSWWQPRVGAFFWRWRQLPGRGLQQPATSHAVEFAAFSHGLHQMTGCRRPSLPPGFQSPPLLRMPTSHLVASAAVDCKQSQQSSQSFILVKKHCHSYERKECRNLFDSCFQNGTSLWSRRTRIWWITSLDHRKTGLAEGVKKQETQNFSEEYWILLIQEGSSKTKSWILCGSQQFLDVPSSNSWTPWWFSGNAGADGIHVCSLKQERLHFSQRLFVARSIYLGEWTDSGWTRKRQSTTSNLLHTPELLWWKSRWRRIPWWLHSSSESVLSQSLET